MAVSKPALIHLNREQSYWGQINLEKLIGTDHPARAIWALTGRLDWAALRQDREPGGDGGSAKAFAPVTDQYLDLRL